MAAEHADPPSLWKHVLKFASAAGLTGMLCCVAPAVLFMFGLMGGAYAISFADFFYTTDGSTGAGAWVLRGAAAAIGLVGVVLYKRKQDQCSIDPKRKRKNLILVTITLLLLTVGLFFTLEQLSGWYFKKYVVPAQQEELQVRSEWESAGAAIHSHSIVAGGFEETSYTTRFTPRTSLMMRLLIVARTS